MRMLTALILLLLQLQPLAGAAVCAYDMGAGMAADSGMTEHEIVGMPIGVSPAERSQTPAAPAECPLVALCTVTAPATVAVGPDLVVATSPPPLIGFRAPEAGSASGVAAPPFHPPIA